VFFVLWGGESTVLLPLGEWGPLRMPSSNPMLKEGRLERFAQGCVQVGLSMFIGEKSTTSLGSLSRYLTALTGEANKILILSEISYIWGFFFFLYCFLSCISVTAVKSLSLLSVFPHQVFLHMTKILLIPSAQG